MTENCDQILENSDDCNFARCELPPHEGSEWHFQSNVWTGPAMTDYAEVMWRVVPDPYPQQRKPEYDVAVAIPPIITKIEVTDEND